MTQPHNIDQCQGCGRCRTCEGCFCEPYDQESEWTDGDLLFLDQNGIDCWSVAY